MGLGTKLWSVGLGPKLWLVGLEHKPQFRLYTHCEFKPWIPTAKWVSCVVHVCPYSAMLINLSHISAEFWRCIWHAQDVELHMDITHAQACSQWSNCCLDESFPQCRCKSVPKVTVYDLLTCTKNNATTYHVLSTVVSYQPFAVAGCCTKCICKLVGNGATYVLRKCSVVWQWGIGRRCWGIGAIQVSPGWHFPGQYKHVFTSSLGPINLNLPSNNLISVHLLPSSKLTVGH